MTKWPSIDPGDMRQRVSLQRQPDEVDGIGQVVLVWPSYLQNVPASIDNPKYQSRPEGRELYDQGQVTARSTHTIVIRWPGRGVQVRPGDRVFFADQTYSPPAIHYY